MMTSGNKAIMISRLLQASPENRGVPGLFEESRSYSQLPPRDDLWLIGRPLSLAIPLTKGFLTVSR